MLAACDAMLHADASSFFTEDTLRPPVPGEEGKGAKYRCTARTAAAVQQSVHKPIQTVLLVQSSPSPGSPTSARRSNEPEGSASPPVPCPLWGESLQTLLEDCDGASLFRAFLASDSSEDMLDFWFACAGYRRLGHADGGRRLRLARAIHRRYLAEGGDGRGTVSQLLSPATRARVRRGVESGRAELSLLDEAQGEVHAALEAGAYVAFLKSDVLAEYARSGGNSPGPGAEALVLGPRGGCYGGEERRERGVCASFQASGRAVTFVQRLAAAAVVEAEQRRDGEKSAHDEAGRSAWVRPRGPPSLAEWREGVDPAALGTSGGSDAAGPSDDANESSEVGGTSEASGGTSWPGCTSGRPRDSDPKSLVKMFDPDQLKCGQKQAWCSSSSSSSSHMEERMKRARQVMKDAVMNPARFAAELTARLERLQRDRRLQWGLEEQQAEGEWADGTGSPVEMARHPESSSRPTHSSPGTSAHSDSRATLPQNVPQDHGDDECTECILDGHVTRTLVCQLPHAGGGSERPRGARVDVAQAGAPTNQTLAESPTARSPPRMQSSLSVSTVHSFRYRQVSQHMHHHYHHHHHHHHHHHGGGGGGRSGRSLQEMEMEATRRVRCNAGGDACRVASDPRTGIDSVGLPDELAERLRCRDAPQGWFPRTPLENTSREDEESGGAFTETTAAAASCLPPLECDLDRAHVWLPQLGGKRESGRNPKASHACKAKRPLSSRSPPQGTAVAYYFCGEPIPYRTSVTERALTLAHFKEMLGKKGTYRYYFRRASGEFDCGVVFEEVRDDNAVLPNYEGKVIGKVERVE